MILIQDQKNNINSIIMNAAKEILPLGSTIDENTLPRIRQDFNYLLQALKTRNLIYDSVVLIEYQDLFQYYSIKIAYSLGPVDSIDESYQELLEIRI